MAQIIDGKKISNLEREKLALEVSKLAEQGVKPGLAVIIVGEDPASQVYVRNKKNSCEKIGICSTVIEMAKETTEDELLCEIEKLSKDESIDGILVQLPLPSHINEERIINAIPPEKDVDAFHPENVGKIMLGNYSYLPCTPAGIMTLLEYEGVEIEGKECVVVGRSNIVGKPMSMLLLAKNGTVTVCHSKTKNLEEVTKRADILVVAVGKAGFIKKEMVKEGAVVIDVGINRRADGKLMGDVSFEEVFWKASKLTPVPGGVGPMTITTLLRNTVTAAKRRLESK